MDAAHFTGTEPLSRGGPVDPERLQRYLQRALPGCDGAMTIERFRGGQSNPTMVLSFDGVRRLVLRKKPDGVLLPSAHAVDREFRVISALQGTAVPVAKPQLLCTDETIVGTMFYIMDYVEGRSFWEPWLPDVPVLERGPIYHELGRVIAELHRIKPADIGLEDFGRPDGYVARQVSRWTKQYRASETVKIDAMDQLIEWLPDSLPKQRRSTLIHGDYRLDNMIFHRSEARILAVVDWELSTIGDPMADFAYHMLTWHFPKAAFRGLGDTNLDALGIPEIRPYRDAYLEATGQQDVSEKEWNTYLAFCLFRVAAIRQGVMKRVLDGTASNPHAREAGELARPVAELGWHYAKAAMSS
ncbi:phosphotransferase family protein [Thalassorhabdomicrobium marinisediminis]|uniref:phosphotransferase family protein n=1 Tax=Thalassorhabdomicrobium marinisediminis TaxID=2170577 RepID=UPI0024937966|nr:phosphotransferase family protein [Thalassorhabdomicrobium marinisediminis]